MRAIAFTLVLVWSARAHAIEKHPDVLPGEAGCERWLGGSSGNDQSVRLNLVLCRDGTRARGRVQWSSLVSGWNVREVEGRIVGDSLLLRDVRIVEEKPENGWRFCVIDRWELRQDGLRLGGTYVSSLCDDHATVWFEKMPDGDAGAVPTPSPSPSPAPTPGPAPSPSPTPDPRPEESCKCGGAGGTGSGAVLILMLWAIRSSGGRRSAGRWWRGRPRRWSRSRS